MIKIIDRYLIKLYLKFYFFSLFVIVSLFLLIDVISRMNRFQVPGHIFLGYYFYLMPWLISQMMPIAGVFATVFLFVGLQRHNELTVFYSMGISIHRILLPIFLVLLTISALGWVLVDKIIPPSMEKSDYFYYVKMKKKPDQYNQLKKRNIWLRTPEAIINYKRVLSSDLIEGVGVYFYDSEKWEPTRIIKADRVFISEGMWTFKKGFDVSYKSSGVTSEGFEELKLKALDDLTKVKKSAERIDSMSLTELSEAVVRAKASSMSSRLLETTYHGKISFIFSAIFLSMLAIPFCLGNQRSSNVFAGVGMALIMVLSYWFVYTAGLNLGKTGVLPPILGAWLAGLVSVFVSVFALKRKRLL